LLQHSAEAGRLWCCLEERSILIGLPFACASTATAFFFSRAALAERNALASGVVLGSSRRSSPGSYTGEGFDDSRLDTLFLAMPISWHGTLQQYVGRLHRLHYGKKIVEVYDYVDSSIPMLAPMFEKRLRGYKALGYSINEQELRPSTGNSETSDSPDLF
jgi:hypothetical protein